MMIDKSSNVFLPLSVTKLVGHGKLSRTILGKDKVNVQSQDSAWTSLVIGFLYGRSITRDVMLIEFLFSSSQGTGKSAK